MDTEQLASTAKTLVAPGRGILAADESNGTMSRRLESIGVEPTAESRRDWRQLVFTADGFAEYVSGVIMFDETIRQSADDGRRLADILSDAGVIAGIKVDRGTVALAGAPGELVTEGLDGLRGRLAEYHDMGARFTKWRAVISIGDRTPSDYCINANAHALGRYAALAQEAGLVPIVEPEVLMDGSHSIDSCYRATERTLNRVFEELSAQGVDLEGIILKPNMVISGHESPDRASAAEVAERTLACLKENVPAAVPGIAFLSGGQGDEEATVNLDAINRLAADEGAPWEVTYSYGRALVATALRTWGGSGANVGEAQNVLLERCRLTSAARRGTYSPAPAGGLS
ncbi:MAG: fructose-bisphosphate aldolase class I [Dehalococcoidia bacterium]|jgi:fructose-bisphosphate aldolase class I|nr:fructose-bisphosphate aldolase class I [Dehalococcoidia bacterium]